MVLTSADYLRQLQALLPPGPAWQTDDDATITRLLSGLVGELARVDGRAWQLLEEADPRTVAELFGDWERVAGLPDSCAIAYGGEQTVSQRRAALVGRLTTLGGQSIAYFVGIASALGFGANVVVKRSTAASYFNSEGLLEFASIDVSRITYDPANLGDPPTLLVEDGATNLLTYSEQFDNAAWSKVRSTVTANATVSPDGSITADKLVCDSTAATSHYIRSSSLAISAGQVVTWSIFFKAAEHPRIDCRFYDAVTGLDGANAVFDSVSKSVMSHTATGSGEFIGASVVDVGGGWLRASITGKSGVTTTAIRGQVTIASSAGSVYITDASATQGVYIWGAQLETGAVMTSYIPSASVVATRAADMLISSAPTGISQQADYAITITEFSEYSVGDSVDSLIYGEDWNFAWQVNAPLNTMTEFYVDGTAADPLASWGNALLECVINRLKPAHTTVIYSYT